MAHTPTEFPAGISSRGPLLRNERRDLSTKGELHTEFDQEVEREAATGPITFGLIGNEIYNERNSTRARRKVTDVEEFFERCTDIVKPDEFLCDTQRCKQIVPAGTPPDAASFLLLESSVEDLDGVHAEKNDYTADSFSTLVKTFVHPELRLLIRETRDLVPAGTETTAPGVAGTSETITDLDCARAMRVQRQLVGWSGLALDLCEEVNFTFPSFLIPGAHFVTSSTFLPQRRRSAFFLSANRRDSFRKLVTARVHVTLHASKPTPSARYTIIPNNLIYDGLLFSVNERAVLNDGGSLQALTNSRDVYYGFGTETYTYTESSPSASQYVMDIGTEQLVGETVRPWQFNLWRREQVFIELE